MIGKHHIVVESPRLKYEFTIKRNLTVIQGDSATGKTTLIELLRDYSRNGNNGTIKLKSDKSCVVDSKAGFQFLQKCCSNYENCLSASGNSNLYAVMRKVPTERVLVVVADGAAFGAYIEKVLNFSVKRGNVFLFLPESFEWIILKSGVVDFAGLDKILETPYQYIESAQYFSWERFFTDLLQQVTKQNKIKEYHKDSLAVYYTEGKNRDRILTVFPEEIGDIINRLKES